MVDRRGYLTALALRHLVLLNSVVHPCTKSIGIRAFRHHAFRRF